MTRPVQLPNEIQCQIIRLCLQNWTARLENHTKPRNDDGNKQKSTLRIWSSKIHVALMLSLTCKSFHAIVQHIQKDPTLFDGTLDLVEEPGSLSYVSDIFRAQYINDPWETPNVMYKTQVFIKNSPYLSSTKEQRTAERQQYHADVRAWLVTHMCRLNIMWDEVAEDFDLSHFSQLRTLSMYWPEGQSDELYYDNHGIEWGWASDTSICDCALQERWVLDRVRNHIDEQFLVSDFEKIIRRGLTILHTWDVEHDHYKFDAQHKAVDVCTAYLRFESMQSSKDGHQIKSLACLQEYARPGQNTPMRFIELEKAKVNE